MICFYHSADFDGFCSGAIVKHKYPDCKLIGINYGDEFPWDLLNGETVYMVDFTLKPFEEMKKLARLGGLVWVDHHPTAIRAFKEHQADTVFTNHATCCLDYASTDQQPDPKKLTSACELTWRLLFPKHAMPYAVRLLGRYDVWDHTYCPFVLPFQYGLRAMTEDLRPENAMHFWEALFDAHTVDDVVVDRFPAARNANEQTKAVIQLERFDDWFREIIVQGHAVLNYEKKQSAIYCRASAFELTFANLPAIVVNRGLPNSTQFESVYDHDRHKLMVAFCWYKKHWKFSLYSDHDDVHCGEICEVFGGGGHKGAGGFYVDRLPLAFYQAMHGKFLKNQNLGLNDGVSDPCP